MIQMNTEKKIYKNIKITSIYHGMGPIEKKCQRSLG